MHFSSTQLLALTLLSLSTTTTLAQSDSSAPAATTAIASTTTATNTNDLTPSQTSAFNAAVASYVGSLASSSDVRALGQDLFFHLPSDEFASVTSNLAQLLPIQTTSVDIRALATNPPLNFTTPAWETGLPSSLQSSIASIETSAILVVATIAQSVVGTSTSLDVSSLAAAQNTGAGASSTGGVGPIQTAAAGMVGLVAGVAMVLL